MNKFFYHFTHLDNLESIIKNGLLCTNKKNKLGITHYNIANTSIQDRRAEMDIICEDGKNYGKVHDYVPFYFSTRNPMLLSIINQKKVDQPELIFFGVKTEMIKSNNFIFTDASANTIVPPNFYRDYDNLNNLSWDLINSKKWKYTDHERHRKMTEVLVKKFDFSFIDHIVVYNEHYRNKVKKIMDKCDVENQPRLEYHPIDGNYFYFTKFMVKGKENENLVTGPNGLRNRYIKINKRIKEERKEIKEFTCVNIEELLENLEADFCFLPQTEGIYELATLNDVHSGTVSDHTLQVVDNVRNHKKFKKLNPNEQNILLLSAYLHDIGKGPHDKWSNRIQPAYADHPKDSLLQSEQIFIEDIEELSDEDIRLLTLLVAYHDILGDLAKGNRSTNELKSVITSENDLKLLYILSQADILAIREDWYDNLINHFEEIKNEVLS